MSCLAVEIEALIQDDSKKAFISPSKALPQPIAKGHPVLRFCKESKSPLLIYGLRGPRKNLCLAVQNQLGEADPRHNYLVIDTINDPAVTALRSMDINYVPAIKDKALAAFAKAHFADMRKQYSALEKDNKHKKKLISYACKSALKTTKDFGISIFFQLEELKFSELNGLHKEGYTTGELRTLHRYITEKKDISHIHFVNNVEEISHEKVKCLLDEAFIQKPQKHIHTFFNNLTRVQGMADSLWPHDLDDVKLRPNV